MLDLIRRHRLNPGHPAVARLRGLPKDCQYSVERGEGLQPLWFAPMNVPLDEPGDAVTVERGHIGFGVGRKIGLGTPFATGGVCLEGFEPVVPDNLDADQRALDALAQEHPTGLYVAHHMPEFDDPGYCDEDRELTRRGYRISRVAGYAAVASAGKNGRIAVHVEPVVHAGFNDVGTFGLLPTGTLVEPQLLAMDKLANGGLSSAVL